MTSCKDNSVSLGFGVLAGTSGVGRASGPPHLGLLQWGHAAAEDGRAVLAHVHEELLVLPQRQRQAGTIHHQAVLDDVVLLDPGGQGGKGIHETGH